MSSHLLQKQPWTSGSTLQRRPLRYLLHPQMRGCSPSLSELSGTWPFVAADLFYKNTFFISPCIHTSSRKGRFGNWSFMETVKNTAYLMSFLLWDGLQSALFTMASECGAEQEADQTWKRALQLHRADFRSLFVPKSTWILCDCGMEVLRFVTC